MKIKQFILSIALVGALTVGVITSASAKFWGTEVISTTDWADGICAYRETCTVHYIFWIAGEEKCTTETIACLE